MNQKEGDPPSTVVSMHDFCSFLLQPFSESFSTRIHRKSREISDRKHEARKLSTDIVPVLTLYLALNGHRYAGKTSLLIS